MSVMALSKRPKATSSCEQPGRTVTKFVKAESSFVTALSTPGSEPPGRRPDRRACSIAVVPASPWDAAPELSPISSLRAETRAFVHLLSTSSPKVSPKRSKLQTAPAALPLNRQFMGLFNSLPKADTKSLAYLPICSLKATKLPPHRHRLPKMLITNSAGQLCWRPDRTSSKAASIPERLPWFEVALLRRSDACFARLSKPGGSMFSLRSSLTISTRPAR
mmetsp:Transcript_13849/g.30539  ORF Transcript_13849/g.30539 Transcript_13849/m.30539 type:complete len:220 (+) Transcript_13849:984-1643(+)